MTRKSALWGIGLAAAGALSVAIALARCSGPGSGSGSEPQHAENAPSEPSASPNEVRAGEPDAEAPRYPVGKSLVAPDASSEPPETEPPSSGAALASAAPSSSAGSTIARALAASQPADLDFLGRIERELHREPPPEVHAMLRRRTAGASREELLGMARALPDLELRVLGLRWVDEVRPAAGADAKKPAAPGAGSAAPFVKPIQPAR